MTYVSKALDRDLSDEPITVLVVDDEEGPREALRMILKDRCSVLTAKDEGEALFRITQENVDVDIVALDIRLGQEDGIGVLQAIKRVAPDVEVFLITGYPTIDSAIRAMRCGAYDYVVKPFDKNMVREVVRRGILRQGQSLYEKREYIRNHRPKPAFSQRRG
ncbi:MAG: response regulator [Candidatus Omnitrophica bacterium]|nr:response regulator [Candidatus Omnitrophota bacterium]